MSLKLNKNSSRLFDCGILLKSDGIVPYLPDTESLPLQPCVHQRGHSALVEKISSIASDLNSFDLVPLFV